MNEAAKRKSMVTQYSAVQVFYWMGACCVTSYAAVFLRGRGFSNTSLGLILAFANIYGLLLSSVLASVIDRSRKINVFHCLFACLGMEAVLDVLLMILPGSTIGVAAVFILLASTVVAVQPLINELCFYLDHTGRYIKYGFSRSMGSLFYVPTTFLVGRLCSNISTEILPKLAIVTISIQVLVYIIILSIRRHSGIEGDRRDKSAEHGVTMSQFIKNNKRFFIFCIGVSVIFFSHYLFSSFMINILESLGGNAASVGVSQALLAAWEVPFMLSYNRITRNIRCSTVITFAAIVFVAKSLAMAYVPSLTAFYILTVAQGLSYALLTPAMVDYASIVVSYKDSAKAQSVSISTTILASVLATMTGGRMLDIMSVRSTLLVGFAVCCVGTVITLLAVDRKKA